jgi:hypothetical protein
MSLWPHTAHSFTLKTKLGAQSGAEHIDLRLRKIYVRFVLTVSRSKGHLSLRDEPKRGGPDPLASGTKLWPHPH